MHVIVPSLCLCCTPGCVREKSAHLLAPKSDWEREAGALRFTASATSTAKYPSMQQHVLPLRGMTLCLQSHMLRMQPHFFVRRNDTHGLLNADWAISSRSTLSRPSSVMSAHTTYVIALAIAWRELYRYTDLLSSWVMTHWIPRCSMFKEQSRICSRQSRRSHGHRSIWDGTTEWCDRSLLLLCTRGYKASG